MRQWLLLLFLFMVAACRPGADDLDLVRRADALWQTDMDSAVALLARVERPELLPRRELSRQLNPVKQQKMKRSRISP